MQLLLPELQPIFWPAWCCLLRHYPEGDLPCCTVVWPLQCLSARQLLCLFQGSCGAFFKAVVVALITYLRSRKSHLRLGHPNPSCCRALVGFELKRLQSHTSFGMRSQEHAATLARLQRAKKRKQDRKDKGTAGEVEESGKTGRVTLQTT